MLVPSTFTGWYKKTMMKQEIASEMIRSRSHTDSTIAREGTGEITTTLWSAPGLVGSSGSGMRLLVLILLRIEPFGTHCYTLTPATSEMPQWCYSGYNNLGPRNLPC